jgi:hypothetical protein
MSVSFPLIDIESDDAYGNSCSRDCLTLYDGIDQVLYCSFWYFIVYYFLSSVCKGSNSNSIIWHLLLNGGAKMHTEGAKGDGKHFGPPRRFSKNLLKNAIKPNIGDPFRQFCLESLAPIKLLNHVCHSQASLFYLLSAFHTLDERLC